MCCLEVEHSIVMMLANLKHYLAVAQRHCCKLFLLVQYDSQFTECLLLDLGSILAEIQGVSKNFWHFANSLSPTQQFVVRKWPIIWLLFTNNKRIMQEYMVQGVYLILCFFRGFQNIPDSCLSLFSLGVSVLTHAR